MLNGYIELGLYSQYSDQWLQLIDLGFEFWQWLALGPTQPPPIQWIVAVKQLGCEAYDSI
jgi:hypothetical protein